MSEILFLSHRIPFPPDRGDKIRSHHILRHLAQLAPVHVATFADDALDFAEEGALAATSASYRLLRRSKPLALAAAEAMVTGKPISLTAFRSAALIDYVRKVLQTHQISMIYVFSGQMGQYVPADFRGRVVADFVDVDSAKFEAYAMRDGGVRGWAEQREARLLRVEEARLAHRADVSLLISDEEAALFRSRLPAHFSASQQQNEISNSGEGALRPDVQTLANGIDSEAFDPANTIPEPELVRMPFPRLIFTGQMDYAPNIDACLRAIERILPAIRGRFPLASFHVVGRNPTDRLTALNGKNGVHVWGRVPEVQPWLAAADLALVPLEIGRGVQNKVLEAMAMALPVVLTPEAATGIGVREELALAVTDAELAEACIALLSDLPRARALGDAARAYVVAHASWDAALARLTCIAGFDGARHA